MEDKDGSQKKRNSIIEKIDHLKEEKKNDTNDVDDKKGSNQFELFENKLRSILFPEPIFSQYVSDLKNKASKPVKFPNVDTMMDDYAGREQVAKDKHSESRKHRIDQRDKKQHSISQPQYTRYLRTWKKNIVHSDKLTNYLSNLRELHLAKLITFIEQMHKNSQYTDLDLYVEDLWKICVHKLILACYAPFIFQKLERNRTKQSSIERLRLVNIDPQAFATIIGFMYTGMAQPSETNFLPVLNTAIHLFMFEFANAWVELYEHKFANRTAQMLFRSNIARQYGWSDYIQMLNLALAFDFEHLLISDQFEDIRFEQLRDILLMDNIGVCSEVVLYLAVLKWLVFNFEERKVHALDLMRLIRFDNMDENELYACYNPPILPEVIEYPEVKAMMADAFNTLVQQTKTIESDDKINKKSNVRSRKPRNYRLASTYKDQPLQLWCHLNGKKRVGWKCLKETVQKDTKEFRDTKEKRPKKDTTDTSSDAISTQFDSPSKYIPNSTTISSASSQVSGPLGQAEVTSDKKQADKSEFKSDFDNLFTSDSLQQHETKLSVLKNKPRLDDSVCRCKQVKHTSVEQCKRERAAAIIQRNYKRFIKLKAKREKSDKRKRVRPKIRATFLGKNIADRKVFTEDTETVDSDTSTKASSTSDDLMKMLEDPKTTKQSLLKDRSRKKAKESKRSKKRKIHKKLAAKDKLGRQKADTISFNNASKSMSQESLSESQDDDTSIDKSIDKDSDKTESFSLSNSGKREAADRLSQKLKLAAYLKPNSPDTLTDLTSKLKTDTNQVASTAHVNEQLSQRKPNRSEHLVLYSDSINPQFYGFYNCSGVDSADGQLTGWNRNLPFNSHPEIKKTNPPFDTVLVSHGQSVYLVGGMQTKSYKSYYVSKQIFKYQIATKKFQGTFNLKTPRIQHSCVVAGDRMYVICGCKKLNAPVNTVECVHLMSSKKLQLKSEILKLPGYGRFGQSSVYFRSRLWIIGGIAKIDSNFHLLSEIWILDVAKENKWMKAKFPVPIAFAGICSVNEEFIYVVGGRCVGLNGKLQPSEKVWCYSVTTKRWQQIVSLNQPRCNCCSVLFENRIYAFGGSLENDAEHLRGQTGEFYELDNPNQGWKMLTRNLPAAISGQSVAVISSF